MKILDPSVSSSLATTFSGQEPNDDNSQCLYVVGSNTYDAFCHKPKKFICKKPSGSYIIDIIVTVICPAISNSYLGYS